MDGFETTKYIKEKVDSWKRPTIIAITASESEEESLQCLLLGMGKLSSLHSHAEALLAYYLSKPIGIMQLTNILVKCEPIKIATPANTQVPVKEPAKRRKGSF